MKISTNWLRDFVDIDINPRSYLYDIIVGHVLSVEKHPNADKLNVANVNIGGTTAIIVCGAPNLEAGQKVPVALPGVTLPNGLTLSLREIRGVTSNGMICAEDEIGLSDEKKEGIMVLPEKWEPGTPMSTVLDLKGLTAGQLGEQLTLHTAEVEEVKPFENDNIIDIDNKSLTHRPDLWSHQGIAREVATITDSQFTPYKPAINLPSSGETIKVDIKAKDACQRFCTLVIKNINIGESPEWMQKRLTSVGINTVNNIVDITNYVMLELGHPMHAFDLNEFPDKNLVVNFASAEDHLQALNNKRYQLTINDIVVSNDTDVLALAGIIGGQNSGVNDKTTSIVLEAATWNAGLIRQISTRHGIRTDASQRFEKALDPELGELAIKKAAELILELCPDAEIAGPIFDYYPNPPKSKTIVVNFDKINNYIGNEISPEITKSILSKLGFNISKETKTVITVDVPSWRATKDINIEADIIEEVVRIYGYNTIEARLPKLPTQAPFFNEERNLEFNLRYNLQGLGATEVYNYSFYSADDLQKASLEEADHLKLKNYLAETQTHLRTSMVPNFLHTIHENIKHKNEFLVFEIGRTYTKTLEFFPAEEKKLIIGQVSKGKNHHFFELKGIIEQLLEQFLPEYEIDTTEHAPSTAHPGQTAQITYKDHIIGYIYNLHPLTQQNYDLANSQISICELNIGHLLHNHKKQANYTPISKYPDLEFDISVIVYEALSVKKLIEEIQKSNPELIHSVDVFDIYRGTPIPEGKKAIAFRITLRHAERTLTDEEMQTVLKQACENLEALGGVIRKG